MAQPWIRRDELKQALKYIYRRYILEDMYAVEDHIAYIVSKFNLDIKHIHREVNRINRGR